MKKTLELENFGQNRTVRRREYFTKMDEDGTAKVQESSVQSPGALKGIPIFNEASDIYEVEKIIAGPHRRREHLVSSVTSVHFFLDFFQNISVFILSFHLK